MMLLSRRKFLIGATSATAIATTGATAAALGTPEPLPVQYFNTQYRAIATHQMLVEEPNTHEIIMRRLHGMMRDKIEQIRQADYGEIHWRTDPVVICQQNYDRDCYEYIGRMRGAVVPHGFVPDT